MTRMALTALGLIATAHWLDSLDGAGTWRGTITLAACFLTIGAFFFFVLGAIGALP
jgi:hypothetical protein